MQFSGGSRGGARRGGGAPLTQGLYLPWQFLLILDIQKVLQLSIDGVISLLYTSKHCLSQCSFNGFWRRGGLLVTAFDSASSDPGLIPGQGHCVVFLSRTLYYHSASLHPVVQMSTVKFNAGGNPVMD